MTGTPFQNRLDDGFALMHFLRIEPFTSHRWWNKLILEPIKRRDGRGIERLQQVMGSICLRRKKGDELNGKKILTLPDKHQRYLEVELTKVSPLHSRTRPQLCLPTAASRADVLVCCCSVCVCRRRRRCTRCWR